MKRVDSLSELFRQLPGIGARQSRRFVLALRARPKDFAERLAHDILHLHDDVRLCASCYRLHDDSVPLCRICGNSGRDHHTLCVVSRDTDVDAIERSGAYHGVYFVLGGSIPLLEKRVEERVRIQELVGRLSSSPVSEIIFALDATTEGEHTEDIVRGALSDLVHERSISLSRLGRGLSTGSELEYADPKTVSSAMRGRGVI